jgi:hypothetical protein
MDSMLEGLPYLIGGGVIMFCLLFPVLRWRFGMRAHELTQEWVERNCNEREKQAFEMLYFDDEHLLSSDRDLIKKVWVRMPDEKMRAAVEKALRDAKGGWL